MTLHYLTGINRVNCGQDEPLADVIVSWEDEQVFERRDHRLGVAVFFVGLVASLAILVGIGWVLVA